MSNKDESPNQTFREEFLLSSNDCVVNELGNLSSFDKIDEASVQKLSSTDAARLINALDDDIERLMKEDCDNLEEEEDFSDDEYELFPVEVKKEIIDDEFDIENILSNPDEYIDPNSFDNVLNDVQGNLPERSIEKESLII